jgi:hypothetical protein
VATEILRNYTILWPAGRLGDERGHSNLAATERPT